MAEDNIFKHLSAGVKLTVTEDDADGRHIASGAAKDDFAIFDASERIVNKTPANVRDLSVNKDASENALTDLNRTADLGFTDLDLTAYTSANAKFAILRINVVLDSYTSGVVYVSVRKNGTTPDASIVVESNNEANTNSTAIQQVKVALDAGQVIEYRIRISGTAQVDTTIDVVGYIE